MKIGDSKCPLCLKNQKKNYVKKIKFKGFMAEKPSKIIQKTTLLFFLFLLEFSTYFRNSFFILFSGAFRKNLASEFFSDFCFVFSLELNMASCGSKSCLALNEKTKQKSEKISDAKFFLNSPLKRIKKELRKSVENSRRSRKNKSDTF